MRFFQWVYSIRVMFDCFMVTHINVMISSIGLTRDIGKKYLPSPELIALVHTARYLKDGLIFHPNLQAGQSFATS